MLNVGLVQTQVEWEESPPPILILSKAGNLSFWRVVTVNVKGRALGDLAVYETWLCPLLVIGGEVDSSKICIRWSHGLWRKQVRWSDGSDLWSSWRDKSRASGSSCVLEEKSQNRQECAWHLWGIGRQPVWFSWREGVGEEAKEVIGARPWRDPVS